MKRTDRIRHKGHRIREKKYLFAAMESLSHDTLGAGLNGRDNGNLFPVRLCFPKVSPSTKHVWHLKSRPLLILLLCRFTASEF